MNEYGFNYYTQENHGGGAPAGGPRPDPAPAPRKESALTRRMAVLIACGGVVTSSVLGFGGGLLAANLQAEGGADSFTAPLSGTSASASVLSAQPESGSGVMSVAQIVSSVENSVVEITTEVTATDGWMRRYSASGAGSGVIYSEDGVIVTNNHVVEGASSITVRLKNGESYPATLLGMDERTDLAVIKIEASGLEAAKLGDSSALQVGDDAVAIGNPLGELGGTVTNGIISALDREITIDGETRNLLQTNAAINPGNSGGGLFNSKGELIGIVSAKSSGSDIEGLGFAIPINDVKPVVEDLIEKGYVSGRGYLGISTMDITDERTALLYRVPQLGVYVAAVENGSAAQAAGLRTGDGILAVDGEEITSAQELKSALERRSAGETVELKVLRDTQELTLTATLAEKIPESASERVQA